MTEDDVLHLSKSSEYRERLRESLVREGIPSHMHEGIMAYVMEGRATGDFLRSVFSNQLVESFRRADALNRELLSNYANILLIVPYESYGSPAKYEKWVKSGGIRGITEEGA